MRKPKTPAVAKATALACTLAFSTALPASPAWAKPLRPQRARPAVTTTTAPTAVSTGASAPTTTSSPMPLPAPPAAAPADSCIKRPWSPQVKGRPTAFQAGVDGAYLWDDPDGGWALRVTHGSTRDHVIFSGALSLPSGRFTQVQGVGSVDDIVNVSADHRTILFRFVNFGALDGLDFATHCAPSIKVNLHIGGRVAPISVLHLGPEATNPGSDPFRVLRAKAGTAMAGDAVASGAAPGTSAGTAAQ